MPDSMLSVTGFLSEDAARRLAAGESVELTPDAANCSAIAMVSHPSNAYRDRRDPAMRNMLSKQAERRRLLEVQIAQLESQLSGGVDLRVGHEIIRAAMDAPLGCITVEEISEIVSRYAAGPA